jgi:hypothetical protein
MVIHLRTAEELHKRFKLLCVERGSNMTAELNWLMTRELESVAKAKQRGVTKASKKR